LSIPACKRIELFASKKKKTKKTPKKRGKKKEINVGDFNM
jgi:hypothetical protein